MEAGQRLKSTYEQMLNAKLPNLYRLYLNPYVVQTCLCLERYVQESWPATNAPVEYQSFLANSFDEALSGAIKLARYTASIAGRSTSGLVIDPGDRLGPFAASGSVVFLPGLTVVSDASTPVPMDASFGFVVLLADADLESFAALVRQHVQNGACVVSCINRQCLSGLRNTSSLQSSLPPDIVVFDESFVHHEVPFGAFTARKSIYDHWNRPAKSTFHSTTFQPNTISTLHFMRYVEQDDPAFYAKMAVEVRLIDADRDLRKKLFRRLYSPSLTNAIAATGSDTANIHADGDFVHVNGTAILDGVSGVACSVRGHNPPDYANEMAALDAVDCEAELTERLRGLTGLEHVLPAVSGAGAVENALKVALVAQFPRRHVLALKSGFGGKTLFALTGTWNAAYKENIAPLYAEVIYVDPFAADAIAQIDAACKAHPIAVVQMELIQGVGGVRRVPEMVVQYLDTSRSQHGYLLLIDEVQTGMFRTGPFTLSHAIGVTPDLLVVGKAVSDMMFPFALMLYSAKVQRRLDQAGSKLREQIGSRYAYPLGFKTAVNVLRYAERTQLSEQVAAAGALISKRLSEELAGCKAVRDVRVFGLLIGIELDATRWPQRWFKKKLFWFYLASMLKHPSFPVLIGFCQYEPNVLKITPSLSIKPEEVQKMCATIGEVLRRPFYQLLTTAVGGMLKSLGLWSKSHEHANKPVHEPAVR